MEVLEEGSEVWRRSWLSGLLVFQVGGGCVYLPSANSLDAEVAIISKTTWSLPAITYSLCLLMLLPILVWRLIAEEAEAAQNEAKEKCTSLRRELDSAQAAKISSVIEKRSNSQPEWHCKGRLREACQEAPQDGHQAVGGTNEGDHQGAAREKELINHVGAAHGRTILSVASLLDSTSTGVGAEGSTATIPACA